MNAQHSCIVDMYRNICIVHMYICQYVTVYTTTLVKYAACGID